MRTKIKNFWKSANLWNPSHKARHCSLIDTSNITYTMHSLKYYFTVKIYKSGYNFLLCVCEGGSMGDITECLNIRFHGFLDLVIK